MESDILDILEQLGYDGPLAEEACLLAECGRGFSSSEYVNLLTWLTKQLTQFTETHTQDEIITADPLDVSRLLKDCCCPYKGLASRLANGDVKDTRDHLKIILFVSSELQSAQLLLSKTLRDAEEREMRSCSPLQDLSVICHTLTLPDPAGRDPTDTFTDIQTQAAESEVLNQSQNRAHTEE
nr:protein FAM98B isoform X1 [Danio rerio]|eukprot:XP_017207171.1 protein FAM98B isoform X1 [Danio rerio]